MAKLKLLVKAIGVVLVTAVNLVCAQDNAREKNYKDEPHWIAMMNDPNVNYFEAVKAFETFWKNKPVPMEEEEWEVAGMNKRKFFSNISFRSKENRKEEESKYIVEYRQFKMWQESMQAYLRPDGTLLSMEERLALWKRLRE
jgi:hypothetical protein